MINFVDQRTTKFADAGSATVFAPIPATVNLGDLMLMGYGNVGNYRATNNTNPTMQNGWTLVQNVTATDNCYFICAMKTATASDVTAAGTDVSCASLPATGGTTVRSSALVSYSGGFRDVDQPVGSNINHVPAPAGTTINTNAFTNTNYGAWDVFFYNAAKATGTVTGAFTTNSGIIRVDAGITVGGGGLTSTVSAGDSNGITSLASHSYTGTCSYTPTRLNGAIVTIRATPDLWIVNNQQAISRASRW